MRGAGGALFVGSLGVAFAASAAAQAAGQPAFGVNSASSEVINAWDMQPSDHTAQWQAGPNGQRYMTVGSLLSGIHVPQGARISSIVTYGCDNSDLGGVGFTLFRSTDTTTEILATANTGAAGAPGCILVAADPASPETVDNDSYRYWIAGGNETVDGSTTIAAVHVIYELQVSPAPNTATFNDVPTSDPAFQYVEALYQSEITAGCGSGNFCPDAPLTRRQMAVLLAKALGLHWPVSSVF
jgi:hypothetical protein